MSTEDKAKLDESGFKVIDRRREGREEAVEPSAPAEDASSTPPDPEPAPSNEPAADTAEAQAAAFTGDEGFAQFIMSLATSAYMHLGLVPGPDGQASTKNLVLAKQTIDILGLLEQKTQGNLSKDESQLINQVVAELRMRFIEEKKQA